MVIKRKANTIRLFIIVFCWPPAVCWLPIIYGLSTPAFAQSNVESPTHKTKEIRISLHKDGFLFSKNRPQQHSFSASPLELVGKRQICINLHQSDVKIQAGTTSYSSLPLLAADYIRKKNDHITRTITAVPLDNERNHNEGSEFSLEKATANLDIEKKSVLPPSYDIPLYTHPSVTKYVNYFSGKGAWFFQKWLNRSAKYIPVMRKILRKKNLPEDLVYLAMIESGFSSKAYSKAAAVGFWQFIGSTGTMYKLRRSAWQDERRDFVRSTEGAAWFLTDLYREFGDWHLAWAAYNAGGGRVRRAMKKHGVKTYWGLVEKKGLPEETLSYVPKVIAAAIVAKNAVRYGFTLPTDVAALSWDNVEVKGSIDMAPVAKRLDIAVEILHELNPGLHKGVTPPKRRHTLRVPKGRGTETRTWIASIPKQSRVHYATYHVRPGDTLSQIANRHGTTLYQVAAYNNLANPSHLRVNQKLVIPLSITAHNTNSKSKSNNTSARIKKKTAPINKKMIPKRGHHVVRKGDTFWSIAKRYNTTVSILKTLNKTNSSRLGIGDRLKIR